VPGYFALDPRSLLPEDTQGTRILLMGALGVTPYIDRALEVLAFAERGNDPEHRAMVIARDGTVAALALFACIRLPSRPACRPTTSADDSCAL
jgi:hypothetical protein